MQRAVGRATDFAPIGYCDGNRCPVLPCLSNLLIKGDFPGTGHCCGSILAKSRVIVRMQEMELIYPGYGIAQAQGLSHAEHLSALRELGVALFIVVLWARVRDAFWLA